MAREGCDRASEGDDGQGSWGPPLLAVGRLVFGLDAGREEPSCRESLLVNLVIASFAKAGTVLGGQPGVNV